MAIPISGEAMTDTAMATEATRSAWDKTFGKKKKKKEYAMNVGDAWIEEQLLKYWGQGMEYHEAGIRADQAAEGQNWESKAAALKWIKGHEQAVHYKRAWTKFKQQFKSQMGGTPYSKIISDEELRNKFQGQYKIYGSEEIGTAVENIGAEISTLFKEKVDAGEIDAETGEPLDPKKAGEHKDSVASILDEMGIRDKFGDDALEHFGEMLKKKDIDEYELRNLLRSTPEAMQAEYDKAREALQPELAARHAEELKLIDTEAERLKGITSKYFAEEISPTIRKEVGMLGGRGREFHAHALAGAAREMEERRQDVTSQMKLQSQFAEIERQRALNVGKFEEAKGITAYGGEQGLKAYESILKQRMHTLDSMQKMSIQKSNALAVRAQERYNIQYMKEQKRLNDEALTRQRSAQKKAGKLGMFANVFQGITSGAMAGSKFGPYGAIAGGVAGGAVGYGQGEIQRKQAKYAMAGASEQQQYTLGNYSDIGYGAGSMVDYYRNR